MFSNDEKTNYGDDGDAPLLEKYNEKGEEQETATDPEKQCSQATDPEKAGDYQTTGPRPPSLWQNISRGVGSLLSTGRDFLAKALARPPRPPAQPGFRRRVNLPLLSTCRAYQQVNLQMDFLYNVSAYFFPVGHEASAAQAPCDWLPVARVTLSFQDPNLFAGARFRWRENLPMKVWYDEMDYDEDSHPLIKGVVMHRRTLILTWLGLDKNGMRGQNNATWQAKIELWSGDEDSLADKEVSKGLIDRLLTREAMVRVQGHYIKRISTFIEGPAPKRQFFDRWTKCLNSHMFSGVKFRLASNTPSRVENTPNRTAKMPGDMQLQKLVEDRFEEQFFGGQAAETLWSMPVVFAPEGYTPAYQSRMHVQKHTGSLYATIMSMEEFVRYLDRVAS